MSEFEVLEGFQATSFVKGSEVHDADAALAALVFMLDVQESMPSVLRLRDWARGMLAVQPGSTVVDVGCGTGGQIRQYADLVGPAGRAVGVEPHAGMRAEATSRGQGSPATYLDGDATALPFDDASVDAVICERVFQHLPDPDAAMREIVRVLKPGGRAVLIDSDWGSMVVSPSDPDVLGRVNAHRFATTPNPFAGRLFRGQMVRAGLVPDPDVAATAVVPPGGMVIPLLDTSLKDAVAAGVITSAEREQVMAQMNAAVVSGEAFVGVTMFGVLGRKP